MRSLSAAVAALPAAPDVAATAAARREKFPPARFPDGNQPVDVPRAAIDLPLVVQRLLHRLWHFDVGDVVGLVGGGAEQLWYTDRRLDVHLRQELRLEDFGHDHVVDQF